MESEYHSRISSTVAMSNGPEEGKGPGKGPGKGKSKSQSKQDVSLEYKTIMRYQRAQPDHEVPWVHFTCNVL